MMQIGVAEKQIRTARLVLEPSAHMRDFLSMAKIDLLCQASLPVSDANRQNRMKQSVTRTVVLVAVGEHHHVIH
jgi:hypothetical protein